MDRDHILKEALTLAPGERLLLANSLLDSVEDAEDVELDESWANEIERRIAEIDRGEVETLSLDDMKRMLRERGFA